MSVNKQRQRFNNEGYYLSKQSQLLCIGLVCLAEYVQSLSINKNLDTSYWPSVLSLHKAITMMKYL